MSDKSRDRYRGLLIPDGDITTIWTAESTVDEAGNRAGIPNTGGKTETVLEASGHQVDDTDGKALEVLSLRGGFPGPGKAGFGWRQTGGTAQDFRGWDVPATIASWENVDFNSGANFNLHPDLITVTRPDGSDYMVEVHEWKSGPNSRVAIRKRDSGVWGPETVIHTETDAPGFFLHPCITQLPTGRLLVFNLVYDTDIPSNPVAQIQMLYSDDEGATWVSGSRYTLPDPLNTAIYAATRIKVAYKDGQILLVISAKKTGGPFEDVLIQYASDDLGTSFLLVSEFSGLDIDNAGGFCDVTVVGGVFLVAWIRRGNPFNQPTAQRLGSAFEELSPTNPVIAAATGFDSAVDTAGNFGPDGDLSIAADRDGVVYLFLTHNPRTQGLCIVLRSLDGGLLLGGWEGIGEGGTIMPTFGRWWGADFPGSSYSRTRPIGYTAEFNRGRAVLVHRYTAGIGAVGENSLCFAYLGGFSTVGMPGLELFRTDTARAGMPLSWLPYGLPNVVQHGAWLAVPFGPPPAIEAIVSPGRLRLATVIGSMNTYNIAPAEGTGNNRVLFRDGFFGRASFEVIGTPSQQLIFGRVWSSAAGADFVQLTILIEDTSIQVVDGGTGAVLASVPNAVGQKRQVFWAVRGIEDGGGNPTGGECAVWIRDWSTSEDRVWTLVHQGALTLTGGGTNSYVWWGDRELATQSDQFWDEFQVSMGAQSLSPFLPFVGRQIAQGQQNPDDLFPRNYAATPLFVDSDTRIAATDGPTFEGDSWAVDVRHLNAAENVIATVSPSPAKVWRSRTATPNDVIAFQRSPDALDVDPANDLYAIHFKGVNFKRCFLEVKVGGVWTLIQNISFFKTFQYTRQGHSIRPAGNTAGSFYCYYNELKDLKFEFNPDGLLGSVVATIDRNSEGIAYEGTAAKPTTIFLDPESFDAATAPASGTAHVWFRDMTVLLRLPVASEGIRLVLCPTGTLPPEGYWEAGQIIPGPVAVFGWDYSRERIVTKTPNVALSTLRDGTRHAYRAGDTRRKVRFSWAEGVDVSELRQEWGGGSDPNWVAAATPGAPVALRNDGPLLMYGLTDRIEGPGVPIVYIPKIDFSQTGAPSFDPRQYARGAIYGRLMSPIVLEGVVGEEETSEVYRVNTLTIEEEL